MTSAAPAAVAALNHETLEELRALVTSPAVEVVSTDVFDTVVWRRVTEPVEAFGIVGARLAERDFLSHGMPPWTFAGLRRGAELRVRDRMLRDRGTTELRLSEIYEAMPDWIFAKCTRDDAVAVEVDIERELLVPDLDVVDVLLSAAEAGKTLIAVSDTYFSADQLRVLLGQEAMTRLAFRHLLTSSDHRENKSGRLFDIALDLAGVAPERIVHLGDNEAADIAAPRRRGIRTVHLVRRTEAMHDVLLVEARYRGPAAALAASSERLSRLEGSDFGLAALRAKMEHRAELAAMPSALQPFWRFGAQIFGPVMAGFAEWVHMRARANGAGRVFCLMREGAFLAPLVRSGAGGVPDPVDAEPLWLNRAVCSRAAIGSATREELEVFLLRRTPPTVREVCAALGVGLSEVPAVAGHADTSVEDPIVRTLLLDELTRDPVCGRIAETSRQLRERLIRYVDRVVGDDEPIVLVDLGWGATIQQRLAKAFAHAGQKPRIVGLYLVTHEGAVDALTAGLHVEGFLASAGEPADVVRVVLRSPEVLEQSCMPAHAAQIDISPEGQPVLGPSPSSSLQHVEAEAVRRGVLAFQREYIRYCDRLPGKLASLAHGADALAPILMRSIAAPTAEEARLFGNWLHDENQGSDLADAMVAGDWGPKLAHMAPEQLPAVPMNDLYWPWGLARRQDPQFAELLAAVTCGLVSPEATAARVETGEMIVEAVEGVGIEGAPRFAAVPRRNRLGLSYVAHTLNAGQISRVRMRIGERPVLVRMDWILLRLWRQGVAEPINVRLDDAAAYGMLDRREFVLVPPNVFVATGFGAILEVPVAQFASGVVFRVDLELGFASLAFSPPPPGPGSPAALASAEAVVRQMQSSVSWRVTKPLRMGKRLRG